MAGTNSILTPQQRRLMDSLDANMKQLRAMLMQTWGHQGESFRGECDDSQDCFMWACSDKVDAIITDWNALQNLCRQERQS